MAQLTRNAKRGIIQLQIKEQIDMTPISINLICPHCHAVALELPADARPIQERKVCCPSCNQVTKLANLKMQTGDTFQQHQRKISPNAKIAAYAYGR